MAEAKSKLAELVGQVKYGGQRFVLERRGRPMAVLISVDEYERIKDRAPNRHSEVSALPPRLRLRQEALVARARALRDEVGLPEDGLARLFSQLPPENDPFWLELQESS
jgi:prevent-host-death family protein